jgi:hypothetical protein
MDWLGRLPSRGAAPFGPGACQWSDVSAGDLAVMVDFPDCGPGAARTISEVSRAIACEISGPVSTRMPNASAASIPSRPARLGVSRRFDPLTLRNPSDEVPARHFRADHRCDITAVLGILSSDDQRDAASGAGAAN